MEFSLPLTDYLNQAQKYHFFFTYGKVSEVVGLLIKVEGLNVFIGEVCEVEVNKSGRVAQAEVVGFVKKTVLLMPLGELNGIGPGCLVRPTGHSLSVKVGKALLGHTLDGLGRIIDGDSVDQADLITYPVQHDSPDRKSVV